MNGYIRRKRTKEFFEIRTLIIFFAIVCFLYIGVVYLHQQNWGYLCAFMAGTKTTFTFICLPQTKLSLYGECHGRLEVEEKEEKEEEKFLRELVTSDICFTSKMVYICIIMLKNAICLIKICVKEHENVLWIFSRSICILILCCTHCIFIVG